MSTFNICAIVSYNFNFAFQCLFFFPDHQLSKRAILELVYASEDFQYLYMLPGDHPSDPWQLDFFINPPETQPAWLNIAESNYTMDEVSIFSCFTKLF